MKTTASIITIIAILLTGCASWTPEKKAAVLQATVSTVFDIGLMAAQQYASGGSVSEQQLAFDGISGATNLLRSLEMPNKPSVVPTNEQIAKVIAIGSGNPKLAAALAPGTAVAIKEAITNGGSPAVAIESAAQGLDKAARRVAITGS